MGSDYGVSSDSAAEHYCSDCADDVYIEGEDDVETESEIESEIDDDEAFDYLEEIQDEAELVNDPLFGAMWCSAIENIQSIGNEDGVQMVFQVLEAYEQETGQSVTADMVNIAVTVSSTLDVVDSEDEETEDVEDLEMAMTSVVEMASALGSLHQQQFVNEICDLYVEENGEEPSLNKLYAIFGDVEDALAESEEEEDSEDDGDIDAETFEEEWSSAMDHIQSLAKSDQSAMVNTICDLYCEISGEEPSTPELYELFAEIKASFAKEATEDVISQELDDLADDDDSDDEDYTIDSDSFYYGFDALDDKLFHDSAYDETDSADSDYSKNEDSAEFTYAQDLEDDLAESTAEEIVEEEEEKAAELDSDSEYSPDKDSYYYMSDYQDELASSSSDASSESESESEGDSDATYDPMQDMFNYPLDMDFDESEEEDDSDDEDYSLEKDEFDYSQDVMDDFKDETEEESDGSAVEDELDSELAA